MLIDILKAIPAIILCYILWRNWEKRVEHNRHLVKAQNYYDTGKLERGCVWMHLNSGRPYTILALTNTGTSKSGWEINVVYTHDFEKVYNRPFSEFCHKFAFMRKAVDKFSVEDFSIMHGVNTRLILPEPGEMWYEDVLNTTDQGSSKVAQNRVRIDKVLAMGEPQPIVVYTVNDKQSAMLLSQFLFSYRKEASFDGTKSSSV